MRADSQIERELDAIDAALQGRSVDPDLTGLAELALLLRDERMDIDAAFADELDGRAAAGFPRPERGGRWRRLLTWQTPAFAGAVASVLLALVVSAALLTSERGPDEEAARSGGGGGGGMIAPSAQEPAAPEGGATEGVSGGGGESSSALDESLGDDAARGAPPLLKPSTAAPGGPADTAGGGEPLPAPVLSSPPPNIGSPRSDRRQARKVETSASLLLATKPERVQRTASEVVRVTDSHRGFVVVSSVEEAAGGGGATFELRIPSERLKPALADLSRLADVRERREATQDITQQFVSARDRLADARAERRGLLRQLERAATDGERERIKRQLRRVSQRIAAAKTDIARVDNRASFSTVAVTIVGDPDSGTGASEEDGAWTPGDAARDALRVLEVAAGVGVIALAIGLPLGLLAALALVLVRVTQRRRRERVLDAI